MPFQSTERRVSQNDAASNLCFCFFSVALLRCLASTVAFLMLSFLNTETSNLISANWQTPNSNYRMYFHVYANVSRSACFPLQSCDVSEDLVCLQLSALKDFVFNFLWLTHSHSLCLFKCKTARTRAVLWQFFTRAGYFCPVCG